MSPAVVGHEADEDFASEAAAVVTRPNATHEAEPPRGVCVNCARAVTLRVVAIQGDHRTFQWVPDGDPARPGRWCHEGSLQAFHWAADATAAVYDIAT